jgi:hypothetical protein
VAGRESHKRRRKRRKPRPAEEAIQPGSVDVSERVTGTGGEDAVRKSRDDLARDELVPLAEGERPVAVTVGAVIATLLAASTLVFFVAGVEIRGGEGRSPGAVVYGALIATMAWGLWRARYWAVLGLQTMLVFLIIVWSFLLLKAANVLAVVISVVVIAAGATLFWFLIKAMARIQMPERRPPS